MGWTVDDIAIGRQADDGSDESQRRDERDSLLILARLIRDDGSSETVRVRNVSSGGLMAQTTGDYRPGVRIDIELDGLGRIGGAVAWAESGRIGIAFDHPVEKTLARKPTVRAATETFRPPASDFRRPPVKSS